MRTKTEIVILNWNGAGHLRRFLPSVLASVPEGVGVVVADNGSTDGSLAVLAEKEHQQQEDGEEAFVDNVIMYEILSELKDIAARPDGIT